MPPRHSLKDIGFPAAVLLIGLAATAAVSVQLTRVIERQDRERFQASAVAIEHDIEDRVDTYVAILRAGAGLLGASTAVSRQDFGRFAERIELQGRYPGIQGIGYSARVDPADLPGLIAARQQDDRGFRVWPDHARDEYHTIVYLEPRDRRNLAAIGYDMFTEPVRREAMAKARDTGAPAATGTVTLVQEIDGPRQPGFLIYVPVYAGGTVPATVEARRSQLRGFVYSPFRAGDLFAGILGRNPRPRTEFALFDNRGAAAPLLYRTSPPGRAARYSERRTIDVAGRPWMIEVVSTPILDETSSLGLVPYVTWGGVGVALLLTALAWRQTLARRRAEESEAAVDDASRRFRQLSNSIPQLAWMARPDGYIYWYNDRWYEYTGTTPAQMEGWGWQRVHDPEVLPRVLEAWKASLQTGEPFEQEFPLRGADGQFRVFLTRVMPFRNATGAIEQWFGTNTDVQYLRDAERALLEQAETLDIVNRSGTQLAGELELDRLVQAVTDAATRLTHAQFGAFFYNTTSAAGESYTLYALSGAPRSAFEKFPMPRNTAVFGPTFRGEGNIRSDDITADPRYARNAPNHGMPPGHLPVRSYLAVPVRSRSGEVIGGLFFGHARTAVFTEQSERIIQGIAAQAAIAIDNARLYGRVQELLASERTARAEAERVSGMKDEFLATLSHELRTPLNAVVGWAHMLGGGMLTEEKRKHAIETILRNARMQSQLIEDLLDMSRIVSGRVRIDMTEVDLREVVAGAADVVRPTADAKRVSLEVAVDAVVPTVRGDVNRLQQVVWNLLTNAVKFTPPGGRATLALRERGGQVEIAVTDTGRGIAPEFLPHVFERFRQGDGSFTRGHGGLGLGLSIARNLVEMHAGAIHASSAGPDRGATFTVSLPAYSATSPEAQADGHPRAVGAFDPTRLRDLHVLVVDDDRDALELTAEILAQHGARVRRAGSGEEALAVLRAGGRPFELLVCDLGMPGMDGAALMRQVRVLAAERERETPAIALTAYAGADDRSRALEAGFNRHLAKPFTPRELIQACAALARHAVT